LQEAVDAGVDAGFVSGGAFLAPAGQAVQSPASVRATHERPAGVALARVATTFRIPGTDHVLRQSTFVPAALAALRLADDRNVNLVQHRRITRR